MNDYLWFLIIVIGIPCICYTVYSIVDRYCSYKEKEKKN